MPEDNEARARLAELFSPSPPVVTTGEDGQIHIRRSISQCRDSGIPGFVDNYTAPSHLRYFPAQYPELASGNLDHLATAVMLRTGQCVEVIYGSISSVTVMTKWGFSVQMPGKVGIFTTDLKQEVAGADGKTLVPILGQPTVSSILDHFILDLEALRAGKGFSRSLIPDGIVTETVPSFEA